VESATIINIASENLVEPATGQVENDGEKLDERAASVVPKSAGENPMEPVTSEKSDERDASKVTESAGENLATREVEKNDGEKSDECAASEVTESAGENPAEIAKITPSKTISSKQPCGPMPGSTIPFKQTKISRYFSSPSGVTVPVVCTSVRSINFKKTEIGKIPEGVSPSPKTLETLASVGLK
jgi:hypothetical protein